MPAKVEHLIALMESFVSGEAISVNDANKLEGALLECSPERPELEDLADDLAQYRPGGGDFLYNYVQMKPKVAYFLRVLRGEPPTT